jgi:hypothetical protein
MALLKRELYRQVKGPDVTHADAPHSFSIPTQKINSSSAKWRPGQLGSSGGSGDLASCPTRPECARTAWSLPT